MKVYVEEAVFSLFPSLNLFFLKALLDSSPLEEERGERVRRDLEASCGRARLRGIKEEGYPLPDPTLPWREAFKKFSAEKGAQSSLESLLSAAKEGKIRPAGALESVMDSISLDFSVPVGAQDLSKIRRYLGLCLSQGRDPFQGPEGERELTCEGEVCYMDKVGAVRRCINWETSGRTCPDAGSRKILFVCESLGEESRIRTGEAVRDLERRLQFYFGAQTEAFSLNPFQPSKRI